MTLFHFKSFVLVDNIYTYNLGINNILCEISQETSRTNNINIKKKNNIKKTFKRQSKVI